MNLRHTSFLTAAVASLTVGVSAWAQPELPHQTYACVEADRVGGDKKGWDWNVNVVVRLACVVTPVGLVRSCSVASEEPSGLGAGSAALHLACLFKLRRTDRSIATVDETVTIPIYFKASR